MYHRNETMKIQVSHKGFALAFTVALVLSILIGSDGQRAIAQITTEQSAAASANATKANFNGVVSNLVSARTGILNNDSVSAYNAINTASNSLFGITQDVAGGNDTLFKQLSRELKPVQNNIGNAREALRDDNGTQALRSLNNADVRLLDVIGGLPPGEED
jgi:hypothetical protein